MSENCSLLKYKEFIYLFTFSLNEIFIISMNSKLTIVGFGVIGVESLYAFSKKYK